MLESVDDSLWSLDAAVMDRSSQPSKGGASKPGRTIDMLIHAKSTNGYINDGVLWISRLTQSVAESSLSPSMLDKQEFYHGAAIVRLLEDHRYRNLRRREYYYLVNDRVLVFLKYSTKSRSPWRFSFTEAEYARLNEASSSGSRLVVALVCGGDGVCALAWESIEQLLGNAAGWISARRKFNESYGVSGPDGELQRKVQLQQWPKIVFEDETELTPIGSEGGMK